MIIPAAGDGELILCLVPQQPFHQVYAFTAWFELSLQLSGLRPTMAVANADGLCPQPFS
jgi:hypothetical protein